jgi:hypothetical protein
MRDTIMKNMKKQSAGKSTYLKTFVSLLIMSLITTMAIYSNYEIKNIKAEYTIQDINFDSPLNNTFYLEDPILVDYSSTTGLKPIGIRTTDIATEDFEVTFSGFGVINYDNKTIKHTSNSSGIYITNPDGTIYQKGIIEIRTEGGNDTVRAVYKSIGDQAGEERVLDNGIIFF